MFSMSTETVETIPDYRREETAFLPAAPGVVHEFLPESGTGLLGSRDLEPGGSGVRAQAVSSSGAILDDFHILRGQKALHVLNAPSPGATSSLAIGEYLSEMAVDDFGLPKA